jgi:hypothetical protein
MAERRTTPVYVSLEEAAEAMWVSVRPSGAGSQPGPSGLPMRQAGHPDQPGGPRGHATPVPFSAVVTAMATALRGNDAAHEVPRLGRASRCGMPST